MSDDHPYSRTDPAIEASRECAVCGAALGRISLSLIRYPDEPYFYGPRCIDRDGCRRRTEDRGARYPEERR